MASADEISATTTVTAAESALSTTLDDEAVILETESGMYYGLNDVATHIWEEIDERRTVAELRESILATYDAEPDQVERDLESVLADMLDNGLIEVDDAE